MISCAGVEVESFVYFAFVFSKIFFLSFTRDDWDLQSNVFLSPPRLLAYVVSPLSIGRDLTWHDVFLSSSLSLLFNGHSSGIRCFFYFCLSDKMFALILRRFFSMYLEFSFRSLILIPCRYWWLDKTLLSVGTEISMNTFDLKYTKCWLISLSTRCLVLSVHQCCTRAGGKNNISKTELFLALLPSTEYHSSATYHQLMFDG